MNRFFSSIPLIFIVIISGCSKKNKTSQDYIEKFYKNEKQLDELVAALKIDTSLKNKYGETFNANQFAKSLKKQLDELEIKEVHVFSWGKKQRQFDFITSWRDTCPIHLYYNTLDSVQTIKGFYEKDQNSNEVWGLDNHWALLVERKLIEGVQ